MKFKIIGRRYDVTDKIRDYVEKKLGKLDKFFKDESEARVVIGTIKDNDYIEATIYAAGMMYRAEASDKEILAAIDKIVDVIERQIRKNKTRLSKKIKRDATLDAKLISGATYTEGEEIKEFEVVAPLLQFRLWILQFPFLPFLSFQDHLTSILLQQC